MDTKLIPETCFPFSEISPDFQIFLYILTGLCYTLSSKQWVPDFCVRWCCER